MKKALVLGAGGFIGSHLIKKLKEQDFWVRGVDLKFPEFSETVADDFVIADLRSQDAVGGVVNLYFDEVYQLAADMGGAGYIFTGENDAAVMYNSAIINLNVLEACRKRNIKNIFYSSSACMYPEHNQLDPENPQCKEDTAYPANPDSEYGWEKLFSERLYFAYNRNHNMNCAVARYHNIYGPEGTWFGGREKAPAAICRKVAESPDGGTVEVWGDGFQTRSFLYIDECIEGTTRLLRNKNFRGPVNIGSNQMVSINKLVDIVIGISGKKLSVKHIHGPTGVRGRNSNNDLIEEKLLWAPSMKLHEGIAKTYSWISQQVKSHRVKPL
jgi:GDP-D-mannose 3', 5'-epimerase